MSKRSIALAEDDAEPIPAFLRSRAPALDAPELTLVNLAPEPEPEPEITTAPPTPMLVGEDIDVFRSEMEARRERSAATLRALDASFTDLEINRDQDVASIRERAVTEEAAVLKRANDQLKDIAERKAQHEAIIAGCKAALESGKGTAA